VITANDFPQIRTDRDPLSDQVLRCALEVHRALGPGLLESAYSACLAHEFELYHVPFKREVPLQVEYKGLLLSASYRLDFLVAEQLVVEIKAVEKLDKLHEAQLLTYLRFSGKRTGLILNFNETLLKNGILRRVL
jgi:GxxExxY protein